MIETSGNMADKSRVEGRVVLEHIKYGVDKYDGRERANEDRSENL